MIYVNQGTKYYKGDEYEIKALDNVTIHIEKGEFVAVMGDSGSGKSTLLNMIGGLDELSSGEIYLDNIQITGLSPIRRDNIRKKYVSYVFQHFALLPEFTCYENIELPLLAGNIAKKNRKERIQKIMEELKITRYSHLFPEQLSGGQKQRVAIARALVLDTPVLLADEPTGALDNDNTYRLLNIFKKIHDSGKTIVVVTHSTDVAQCADRIIYLDDGAVME